LGPQVRSLGQRFAVAGRAGQDGTRGARYARKVTLEG
jgi:hypothetical protein